MSDRSFSLGERIFQLPGFSSTLALTQSLSLSMTSLKADISAIGLAQFEQ